PRPARPGTGRLPQLAGTPTQAPSRVLVAAGRDVAPVLDGVAHRLRAARAVRERECPVPDLAAAAVLLDVIPVSERVLVLELRRGLGDVGVDVVGAGDERELRVRPA